MSFVFWCCTKMYLIITLILTAFILFVKYSTPRTNWNKIGLSFVKPWPLVGNMGSFVFAKLSLSEITQNWYNQFNNKRLYGFFMFMKPMVVIRDLDLIKQTAVKDFDSFVDRRRFISEREDPLFGKSLFSLTGQKWKDMRSILSPAFSSSKMKSMFLLISECAQQLVDHIEKKIPDDETLTLEMKDVFGRAAMDVIASSAFGIKCDSLSETNEFYEQGKECADFDGIRSLKLFGYTFSPEIMSFFKVRIFNESVTNFFNDLVSSTMEIREKEHIYRPDMIHLLMEAKRGVLKHEGRTKLKDTGFATVEDSDIDKKEQTNKPVWTQLDMTAQALFFFFAGFETTSTLLCHMANELALNPDIQTRLQTEIDEAIDNHGDKVTYDTLLTMKYLDMVISEALRKWPPVPIVDRACVNDTIISPTAEDNTEFVIKKNDVVMYPIFGIHRDPKYYPDPEKFDPERFNDENKHSIQQLSYLPFGIGPRGCIGSRFALLEAKAIYFYLLSKFNIVVVKETQIPFKFKMLQFNLHAEKGFYVGFRLRNK